MSLLSVAFAVWVLAPILVLIGLVAWMEWYDERQWRRDEQRATIWMGIEDAFWRMPPAEGRHEFH